MNLIEHHGEIWGYKSYICLFPEQKLGIVILSNLSSFNPEERAMKIADVILNNDLPDAPANNHKEALRTVKISTENLAKFTGLYWVIEAEQTREIYLKKGQLMYKRGPGNESVLLPISKNRFRMLGVAPMVRQAKLSNVCAGLASSILPGVFIGSDHLSCLRSRTARSLSCLSRIEG